MNWKRWGLFLWVWLAVASFVISAGLLGEEAKKTNTSAGTTNSKTKAKLDQLYEQRVLYFARVDDPVHNLSRPERHGRPVDPTKDYMPHSLPKSQYEEVVEAIQQEHARALHRQKLYELTDEVIKHGYSQQLTNFRAGPKKWGGWGKVDPIGNADYFVQTCQGYAPIEILHQFRNYQHPGFVDYLEQVPGAEEFLLGLEDQLMSQKCSPLKHYICDNTSSKEYAVVMGGMRNALAAAKARIAQREVVRQEQVLQTQGFNRAGLDHLARFNSRAQFVYDYTAPQARFMNHLGQYFNELGEFYTVISKKQNELVKVADVSHGLGLAANQANRQQCTQSAGHLLNAAQNILAFGKGVLKSGDKFAGGIIHAVRHPIDTACGAGHFLVNAGTSIVKAANSGARLIALSESLYAPEADKQAIYQKINLEEARWGRKKTQAYQIYQAVELAYQNASQEEVCEKTGEIVTDLVLACYGHKLCGRAIGTTLKVSGVAKYQPVFLRELEFVRQDIYQLVGLAAQYGSGKVKRGLELVQKYPALAKPQATLAQSIKGSCDWIKTLNKQYSNALRNVFNGIVERELVATEASTGMLVETGPSILLNEVKAGSTVSKYTGSGFYANKPPINTYGEPLLETAPGWFLNLLESEKTVWMTTESGLLVPNRQLCDGICHTFLHKSVIGRNPHCLDHMIPQIKALEHNYLRGMSVQEFVGPKIAATEEFRKRVEFGKNVARPDYFHWLHPTPGIKPRDGELLAHRFSGFHLDYQNTLENMGEISTKVLKVGPEGATRVKVKVAGVLGEVENTCFCSDWDLLKLAEKARESYFFDVSECKFQGTDLKITSTTRGGLQIRSVISDQGVIKTLVPEFGK